MGVWKINKLSLFFSLFIFCECYSQIINPVVFTYTTPFTQVGQINEVAEDTINNLLHFQNSCDCGVGPANKWTMLSKINLNSNVIATPYYQYGAIGNTYKAKSMHASNSKVFVNDQDFLLSFNSPNYSQQWNYTAGNPNKIVASAKRNDSIFTIIDDGSFCQRLVILNAVNGSTISFNTVECSTWLNGYIFGNVLSAEVYSNKLYLVGGFYLMSPTSALLDSNAITINLSNGNASGLGFQANDTIKDIQVYNNFIHVAGNFTSIKGQVRNRYAKLNLTGLLQNFTPSFNGRVEGIELYDNYLFAIGKYSSINGITVNPSSNYYLKAINLTNNTIMNWNFPFTHPILVNDEFRLKRIRNRLYYFSRQYSGTFIEASCLPPLKPVSGISTNTTSICELTNNVLFTVSAFPYASNYTWNYSGSGVILTPNSNSLTVHFLNGATSGLIKVCAHSVCGSTSDTLSVPITILPRPGANAILIDDTLNCFKPKVPLLASSPTNSVSYFWNGPLSYTSSSQNDSTFQFVPGAYSVTVTSLLTGCSSSSSVLVRLDTLKPNVTLPAAPYIIPCNPNFLALNGTSTTTPNLIQWRNVSSSTYSANPCSVYTPGTYLQRVQSLYNGCINSNTILVTQNNAKPSVTLVSHPNYSNALVPTDTITCLKTSITLSASYSPTNCLIQWKSKASGQIFSNPLTVTSQGNFFPIVTRTDNNCADSSLIVFIAQDQVAPINTILTASPSINCSYNTATLNAVTSVSNASTQWTGPASFSSTNPALTNVLGTYYFKSTNLNNGCFKLDSVQVVSTNQLIVNAGSDTLVCKLSPVLLSATVAGTISNLNYSWSSGHNGQTISVTNSVSTLYVVSVNGSGCIGSDTVMVNIPPNLQDSIVTSKGCSGNTGSLIVYINGGIPPYKYAINGSQFSSNNTFTNLAFGTYTIDIKDSLGCSRSSFAVINQNSNSVAADFIVSTSNFKGDTVVFIDLTVPKADSISWNLPPVSQIIGGDMYKPMVVFSDTGHFVVTMDAWYPNCKISTTKLIRIFQADTNYATLSNYNGIKSVTLFPNPNSGVFTVQVEFYKKQNAIIQVFDALSIKKLEQNFHEVTSINSSVNLPQLTNGTYVLKIVGEYASKNSYFIISK